MQSPPPPLPNRLYLCSVCSLVLMLMFSPYRFWSRVSPPPFSFPQSPFSLNRWPETPSSVFAGTNEVKKLLPDLQPAATCRVEEKCPSFHVSSFNCISPSPSRPRVFSLIKFCFPTPDAKESYVPDNLAALLVPPYSFCSPFLALSYSSSPLSIPIRLVLFYVTDMMAPP